MSRKKSTRQLIGIDDIKNDSVVTADGELAFYFVHPSNLNVYGNGEHHGRKRSH